MQFSLFPLCNFETIASVIVIIASVLFYSLRYCVQDSFFHYIASILY